MIEFIQMSWAKTIKEITAKYLENLFSVDFSKCNQKEKELLIKLKEIKEEFQLKNKNLNEKDFYLSFLNELKDNYNDVSIIIGDLFQNENFDDKAKSLLKNANARNVLIALGTEIFRKHLGENTNIAFWAMDVLENQEKINKEIVYISSDTRMELMECIEYNNKSDEDQVKYLKTIINEIDFDKYKFLSNEKIHYLTDYVFDKTIKSKIKEAKKIQKSFEEKKDSSKKENKKDSSIIIFSGIAGSGKDTFVNGFLEQIKLLNSSNQLSKQYPKIIYIQSYLRKDLSKFIDLLNKENIDIDNFQKDKAIGELLLEKYKLDKDNSDTINYFIEQNNTYKLNGLNLFNEDDSGVYGHVRNNFSNLFHKSEFYGYMFSYIKYNLEKKQKDEKLVFEEIKVEYTLRYNTLGYNNKEDILKNKKQIKEYKEIEDLLNVYKEAIISGNVYCIENSGTIKDSLDMLLDRYDNNKEKARFIRYNCNEEDKNKTKEIKKEPSIIKEIKTTNLR
jgi:hypothetical protein